jgi:hypothetical protein
MAKATEELGLIEQLRQAIQSQVQAGVSLNQLGKESRVGTSQISRFMRGIRTLTLPAAERICQVLHLRLTQEPSARKQ